MTDRIYDNSIVFHKHKVKRTREKDITCGLAYTIGIGTLVLNIGRINEFK
jgi:hypothetical protein